jgi:hypothetical protein
MPNELDYQQQILQYQRNDLLTLWQAIKLGNTPDWPPGKAFEYFIIRAFQLEGADVCYPFSVILGGEEIEQIDGAVYTGGLACLIECKDQQRPINIEPIAKLRNQLLRRPATAIGSIFSRSGFTEPATTLARFLAPQTILLWKGEEIDYALRRRYMCQGLIAKYRYCVEHSLPNYEIT